jgi:hypothetical protein
LILIIQIKELSALKLCSIHIPEKHISQLNAACLAYNSKLAVYYLLLSSGRFASYIPEVNVDDLLRVPIPELSVGDLQNIKTIDDIDERIRQAFEFKDSEWVLINDLFNYTLPDFKGDSASPGRQRTIRKIIVNLRIILNLNLQNIASISCELLKQDLDKINKFAPPYFRK